MFDSALNQLNGGEDTLLCSIKDSSGEKLDDGYILFSKTPYESASEIDSEDLENEDSASIWGSVKRVEEYGDDNYAFQINVIET